jgi:hypothetical protein
MKSTTETHLAESDNCIIQLPHLHNMNMKSGCGSPGQMAHNPVRILAAMPAYELLVANVKESIW